jgi:hypothetical protein
MRKISLFAAFCIAVAFPALAQSNAGPSRNIDKDFVLQQFGDQFTLLTDVPPAFGDLDGDGIEDVVIAARCKNALLDQAEHNYKVVDPYYEYFGYGDPRITTTFSAGDPAQRGLVALIIHGSGPEAWRSPKPKAKYVIVNLPFKTLSVRKIQVNKRLVIDAVYVEEAGELGDCSAVFYDPKKFRYRYVPMGGSMQ